MRDVIPIFGCELTKAFEEVIDQPLAALHNSNIVLEAKSSVLKAVVLFATDEYRGTYRGDKVIFTYRDLYRLAKWKPKADELVFLHSILRTFPNSKIAGTKTGLKKEAANG